MSVVNFATAHFAKASVCVSGLGLLLAGSAAPLCRRGWLSYDFAVHQTLVGAGLLAAGVLLALMAWLVAALAAKPVLGKPLRAKPVLGVVTVLSTSAALLVLGYLANAWYTLRALPPLKEISTDLSTPPPFVAIKEIRATQSGVNASDYAPKITLAGRQLSAAEAQLATYPDIQPLILPGVAPAVAFARIEAAVRALGWQFVASVPSEGRLEATALTAWFGRPDDIVVRLRVEGGSSRIDVRSQSREAARDGGSNAAHVRALFAQIGER